MPGRECVSNLGRNILWSDDMELDTKFRQKQHGRFATGSVFRMERVLRSNGSQQVQGGRDWGSLLI